MVGSAYLSPYPHTVMPFFVTPLCNKKRSSLPSSISKNTVFPVRFSPSRVSRLSPHAYLAVFALETNQISGSVHMSFSPWINSSPAPLACRCFRYLSRSFPSRHACLVCVCVTRLARHASRAFPPPLAPLLLKAAAQGFYNLVSWSCAC